MFECVQRNNAAGCAYTHKHTRAHAQCTSRICTEVNKHLPSNADPPSFPSMNSARLFVWITRTVNWQVSLHQLVGALRTEQSGLIKARSRIKSLSLSLLKTPCFVPGLCFLKPAGPTPGCFLPTTTMNHNLLTAADLCVSCTVPTQPPVYIQSSFKTRSKPPQHALCSNAQLDPNLSARATLRWMDDIIWLQITWIWLLGWTDDA